ncbi:MAG: hypothetical protein SFU98_03465 [Leptospiraceae bacterium]|nr:hypothetical protein [Leptospiraceae bacterium]
MPVGDIIFQRFEKATFEEKKRIYEGLGLKSKEGGYDAVTISKEFREAGGHSFKNPFRDIHDLPYKNILIDVADKLKPGLGWTDYSANDKHKIEEIEAKVLEFILIRMELELNSLSNSDRKKKEEEIKESLKKSGYTQAQIGSFMSVLAGGGAAIGLASSATVSLFYSSFFATMGAALFGVNTGLLALTGTGIGAVVGIPLLAATLGNTAYRKTIPTTLAFIAIGQRLALQEKLL